MTHRTMRRILLVALIALPMLAAAGRLSGCAASGDAAVTLDAATDTSRSAKSRIRTIDRIWEVESEGRASRESVRESLKRVAWARTSAHWTVRLAAINALLEDQPGLDDTRNMLRLMLPTEPSFDIIRAIGDIAARQGWDDLASGFVRRWSEVDPRVVDEERSERIALERMFPDRPVEDVVFDVFIDRDIRWPSLTGESDDRYRYDAWALLRRLENDDRRTVARLEAIPPSADDPLVETIRAGAVDLAVVPTTRAELEWLVRLHESRDDWRSMRDAVQTARTDRGDVFELRHLPVIERAARLTPDRLARSRDELLAAAERRLEGRRRVVRARGAAEGDTAGETIRRSRDDLSRGDALALLAALDLLEDPVTARAIFSQAVDDMRDTSTEHGGLFDIERDGAVVVRYFAPRAAQRRGDRTFVASPEMISASDRSAFHYHLHAQRFDNNDYAGPSGADIEYARRQGRQCLVFTFVDENAMNVDYYQPDGAVIDLGLIHRPAS